MKNISRNLTLITTTLIPCYIFRFNILGIKTNLFELLVLFTFLATIFTLNQKSEKGIRKSDTVLALLLLLAAIISSGVSHFDTQSLGIVKGWFLIPIIYAWILVKNFDFKQTYKISLALYISLLLVTFIALLQKIGLFSTIFYQVADSSFDQYLQQGRLFGVFESPNYLAMFLVPVMLLSFPGVVALKDKSLKYVCMFLYVLPLFVLYLTASRAGVIALLVSGIFARLLYGGKNIFSGAKPYLAIFITSFIALLNILYLFFSVHGYQTSRGGDLVRIEIYKYSIQILKGDWLFGIGLGNFQDKVAVLSASNSIFQSNGLSYALHPHNLFLAIWLNLGLLGILVFMYLLYIIISKLASRLTLISVSVLSALTAILIHGLFDTTYFKNDLSAIFWLIFAYSIIIFQKQSDNDDKLITKD